MAGGGLGSGLTAQLAQQQQQLMAMVQTQSLLAAMQAQANANAQAQVQARAKQGMQSSMGLLPTPLIPRNQSRDLQRQNRKRGRNDSWGGGNQGNKRERFDHNRRQQGGYRQQNRNRPNQQSQQAKKTATPDKQETKKEEAVTEEELHEEKDEATQGSKPFSQSDSHCFVSFCFITILPYTQNINIEFLKKDEAREPKEANKAYVQDHL